MPSGEILLSKNSRSVALALVIPVGGSCSRQDSRNGDSLVCAPVRPAPGRSSATSSARGRPRAAHRPYANGLTAFRMRSACCLRSFGTIAPSPLRQHARAYTYRGLPAFAFALHGRQRLSAIGCGGLTRAAMAWPAAPRQPPSGAGIAGSSPVAMPGAIPGIAPGIDTKPGRRYQGRVAV